MVALLPAVVAGCPGRNGNSSPEARAGEDQVVTTGADVTLDGSGSSDPDGNALTFSWAQVRGTPVVLSSSSEAVVTFTAPAKGTTAIFLLTVSDGQSSATAQTRVAVRPADSTVQVQETRQPSVRDDPAVAGNFPANWSVPGPPPGPAGPPNKGAHGLLDQTLFAPFAELELAAGATHEVELQVAAASRLSASVRWIGTTDPLDVTLALDGAVLATGTPYQFATDRGGASLEVTTSGGGRATVTVTNTSGVTVTLRVVLGALDLALVP